MKNLNRCIIYVVIYAFIYYLFMFTLSLMLVYCTLSVLSCTNTTMALPYSLTGKRSVNLKFTVEIE